MIVTIVMMMVVVLMMGMVIIVMMVMVTIVMMVVVVLVTMFTSHSPAFPFLLTTALHAGSLPLWQFLLTIFSVIFPFIGNIFKIVTMITMLVTVVIVIFT